MDREGRSVGRYVLYDRIASGGMAQVHLGRLVGAVALSRTVAIKRLLPHCATDAEIVPMFVDEARLAARIRHPNVVGTLDVVQEGDELLLVMEYVHGESLARLVSRARTRGIPVPPSIAVAIGISMLEGLHAAHEARSERGEPLGIVHRDVSPQNVIIGADGVARVVDFGIAKARGRIQTTRDGQLKGKAGYIAPEQLRDTGLDRRVDVYAAAVVLWEVLAGRRLFEGDGAPAVMRSVLEQRVEPPSHFAATAIPRSLDDVIMRGLARTPADRFDTAREMAVALEHTMTPASAREIERWVESLAAEVLASRAALLAAIESDSARVFTDGKAGERTYAATSLALPLAPPRGKPSDDVATTPISFTASPGAAAALIDAPVRPPAPPSRAARTSAPWIVAGVLLFGGLFAFGLARVASPPAEATRAAQAAPPSDLAVGEPSPSPSPEPVAAPSLTPVSEASAPSPSVTVAAPRRPATVARPAPRPKGDKAPGCQVPFTRAPDGTKIPKPECF